MRKIRIEVLAVLMLVALSGGCASRIKVSMYRAAEIDSVDTWFIDFADAPGRYEQTIGTRTGGETRIINEGYAPVDLQLREDFFFAIRDSYRFSVTRVRDEADGFILLRPLHFTRGGYKSLHVFLADEDGEYMARIRVNNGGSRPIEMDNEKFAELCGAVVVKVLKNPYVH